MKPKVYTGWIVKYHATNTDTDAYVCNSTSWQLTPDITEAHVFGCNLCVKSRLAHTEVPKGYTGGLVMSVRKTVSVEPLDKENKIKEEGET